MKDIGLREYFAANAPPEVPEWFQYETRLQIVEYNPENSRNGTYFKFRDAMLEERFFAWRWHYADKMIENIPTEKP